MKKKYYHESLQQFVYIFERIRMFNDSFELCFDCLQDEELQNQVKLSQSTVEALQVQMC